MTKTRKVAVVQLVVAALAAVGGVLSWLSAASTEVVAPLLAGEPERMSTVYSPGFIALALVCATVAGVALVLAIPRWRRG